MKYILNPMHGEESVLLFSGGIIGVAYTVVPVLLKSITRDMQKEILVKNQSIGSSQSASLVMTLNITKPTHRNEYHDGDA
jgi:hypothetical protein